MPDEIAVGENPEQLAFLIRNHGRAGPDVGHRFENRPNGGVWGHRRQGVPRPHDLVDPQKQAAPDHSRGMEPGEILLLEAARFEQDHGERIPEGEHDGRAGGRGKIQGAGLLFNVHVQDHVRVLGQAGIRVAADGDDLDLEAGDRRQDAQHFLGFPAGA